MKRNTHRLIRSIRWIALLCLVTGSALGTWGCAGDQGAGAALLPSGPIPSSTSTSSAAPTPSFLISDPEESGASFALRGVWIHPKSIATQERADATLTRVQSGNFNAVFVLIFLRGYAYYDSAIAEREFSLALDYDPLGYVVTESHRRGLQVHAWFVVGQVGTRYEEPGPVLSRHPEWGMVDASGGSQIHWLNFARPDARQFISDLILEVVQNYGVDGVHLDYIRYPGSKWSFDAYSVNTLASEYGVDLESLRYTKLPAYGSFHGNPLAGVWTAEVLAKFDDGVPAVLSNTYGQGKAIVLNWHAEDQQVAASSEILRRSIEFLLGEGGQVHIFRSETNEAEYTATYFEKNRAWLENLGWEPGQVTEEDLVTLGTNSVLVLPNVYVMKASTATGLARFVERGGGLIFIDGPVRAMKYKDIRAVTGMRTRKRYFTGERMLLAVGESELVPTSGEQAADPQVHHERMSKWNAFREESVSALVQDVYQRVKAVRPEVQVSAAVYRKRSWAADVFQNWYGWLADGYVDFVVPMAYVHEASSLDSLIDEWQGEGIIDRVVAGLAVANFDARDKALKTSEQVILEVELLQRRGINGVVIFDLEHISDDQFEALATGPLAR